jgi:hypothetical protein
MKMLLVGAVGVLALQALFVSFYLALTAPDPLVTRGVQKVVLCGGSTESGNWLYKIMEDTPTSGSGTWGTEEYGYCQVWLHYADTGEAD